MVPSSTQGKINPQKSFTLNSLLEPSHDRASFRITTSTIPGTSWTLRFQTIQISDDIPPWILGIRSIPPPKIVIKNKDKEKENQPPWIICRKSIDISGEQKWKRFQKFLLLVAF